VVTAKRLYVIECKNWTGTLSVAGDRWIQKSYAGKVTQHEDVLLLNTLKMKLLVEYLQTLGIWVQPERVCQKLIFMNPKLNIASLVIAKNFDVVTPDRLEAYLGRQDNQLKPHEQLFASVIGLLLDEELKGKVLDGLEIERVGGEHHDRLIQEIGKLATWDKILLHGTKILSGDIIDRSIPHIFTNYTDRLPIEITKEIKVGFVRSKWWGLLKAFLKIGRPIGLDLYDDRGKLLAQANGNPSSFIRIHEAGSKEPIPVDILQIDRIISGKHVANTSQKALTEKPIKTLLTLAIGGALILMPSIRDRLFLTTRSAADWLGSLGDNNSANLLDRYTGNYDFGRYAVKVYKQKDRLFAETAEGKATLEKTNLKSGHEFTVVARNKGKLGKYLFVKNQQGQVRHLIWVQTNGKQRKCPKI
jgi:hypothetical protein